MRTVIAPADRATPRAWRGPVAFALDNLVPVLGLFFLVVGAFHLPGIWGNVGGWAVAGLLMLKVHGMLQDEIKALKDRARSDEIEARHARARAGMKVA